MRKFNYDVCGLFEWGCEAKLRANYYFFYVSRSKWKFEIWQCLHVLTFQYAGEYERVQKKAFTNWVNSHLVKVRKHARMFLIDSVDT